jgi:hypothetical protein
MPVVKHGNCLNILIHVRENRRDIQEWEIGRHWQHLAHKTEDEDRQNTKTQHSIEN